MAAPVKTESKTKSGLFGFGKKEKPATPDTQAAPTVSTKAPKEESLDKRFRRETQELADAVGQMHKGLHELELLMAEAVKLFGGELGNDVAKLQAEFVQSMGVLSQRQSDLASASSEVPMHFERARNIGKSLLAICEKDLTAKGAQDLHDRVKEQLASLEELAQDLAARSADGTNGAAATTNGTGGATASRTTQPNVVPRTGERVKVENATKDLRGDKLADYAERYLANFDSDTIKADLKKNQEFHAFEYGLEFLLEKFKSLPQADQSKNKDLIERLTTRFSEVWVQNTYSAVIAQMDQCEIDFSENKDAYKQILDAIRQSPPFHDFVDVSEADTKEYLLTCAAAANWKKEECLKEFDQFKGANKSIKEARKVGMKVKIPKFDEIVGSQKPFETSTNWSRLSQECHNEIAKLDTAKANLVNTHGVNKDKILKEIDSEREKMVSFEKRATQVEKMYFKVHLARTALKSVRDQNPAGTPQQSVPINQLAGGALNQWKAEETTPYVKEFEQEMAQWAVEQVSAIKAALRTKFIDDPGNWS